MYLIRALLFSAGLFFLIHQVRFHKEPDKYVIELLVILIYDGIAAFFCLFSLMMPYLPDSGCLGLLVRIAAVSGFLFSAFLIGLALFTAVYPLLEPSKLADGSEQLMIVLGAPVWKNDPTTPLQTRCEAAARWIEQHPNGIVILSGGKPNYITEAAAMKKLLTPYISSSSRIILEENSMTTDENFIYSAQLLQSIGMPPGSPVVLTTSSFHYFRMRYYARRNGFTNIRYLPAFMPRNTGWMWYFREAIVTVRFWILKK